jgi:hypothetical protein
MRSRVKRSVIALFAAAAVWSLAGASAIAAPDAGTESGRTAPSGLEFRFDKDAFAVPAAQTEIVETRRLSRFAIRLYGGLSRVAAGDVNDGSDGFFELLEVYDALGLGTAEGGYSPVHWGANFGADLIFQLSRNVGIGLGVGYMRNSEDSEMIITNETESIALTATPTLSAVPIRLGVFFTIPVAGKIDLTADLGAAVYAGLKLDATQRIEFAADDWMEMTASGSRSSFDNLGFHGSLGFEYEVSPTLGLFVEAAGRYAKFKNFDSVTGLEEYSDGSTDTQEGKLYIVTYTFADGSYSPFTIEDTPPVDDPPDEIYREPKIDLSGFSLQAGIRIRF